MMNERNEPGPRPIYEPIRAFAWNDLNPQEWDADRQLRLQRLQQIVWPSLERSMLDLPDQLRGGAGVFIQEKYQALQRLCDLPAQRFNELRDKSRLDCDLLSAFGRNDYCWESTGANNPLLTHTKGTLRGADIFLKALTPEMGLNLTDNYQTVRKNIQRLALRNLALETHVGWFEFATVIPGIVIFYHFDELPKKARRFVNVEASLVFF